MDCISIKNLEVFSRQDDLQDAFIRQNSARINCQNAKEKMGSTLSDFDALRDEVEELKKDLLLLDNEKSDNEKKFNDSLLGEEKERKIIEENSAKLVVLRNEETVKIAAVSDIQLVMEKLYQKQEFEQLNLDRIKSEADKSIKEKEEIIKNRSLSDEEIEFKKESIKELEKTRKTNKNQRT